MAGQTNLGWPCAFKYSSLTDLAASISFCDKSTLGVSFSISYGQTEASPGITQNHPDDSVEDKATTAGPPLPQTEVKIIDTDDTAFFAVRAQHPQRNRRRFLPH